MDSERILREARRLTPEGQLVFEESQELMKHLKEYEELSRKYDDYLVSQRCDESSRERASHSMIASSIRQKAIDNLETMLQAFDMEELHKVKTEQLSEIIQPSDAFREPSNIGLDRKSRCSRGSSHLSRQRAKVEAAKTRAKFAQEEGELMRKQTAIQADMKLLKRDIEEAECELRVLNENFDDDCAISEPNKEDIQRRTAEFILKQTDQNDNTPLTQNLNVDAPTFIPAVVSQIPTTTFTQTDACREFTQFIVKKDLLLSRLCKYDDTPGYFLAWKASFTNVMQWRTLVRAISLLKQLVRNLAHHNDKPEHLDAYKQPDALKRAQQFIIREVQIRVVRDGKAVSYVRPINELVMLVEHVELKQSETD
ncbi:unnamed protein product [Mytilus coruscus]|uniref:Uncharacterized protein n=1 Tax=Mytilus coruscus TaxID=42192 RepID=A0A6J8APW5_MYTCO|nr:unnamed protein product [Mytilus coruscus]